MPKHDADVREYQRKANVEAVQITGPDVKATEAPDPPDELIQIARWMGTQVTSGADRVYELEVRTNKGPQYARSGDWIVRDATDHFVIMSDEEFHEVYEPAS